jgi:hypothetical protein
LTRDDTHPSPVSDRRRILRQLHAVITTGQRGDPEIAANGHPTRTPAFAA